MRKLITGGLAAITFAGAVSAAGVASAQSHNNYRHHHDNSGAAVAAGIAGLAIGAAIASSGNNGYSNGYYDNGYYNRGYYDRGYYDRGYGYGYDYGPRRCRTYTTWDPYYGEYVQHRRCWTYSP